MKFLRHLFPALLLSSMIGILFVSAATPTPDVDTPASPVDANKAVISGESEPGAKIIVTGGIYDLPPAYADEDGNFEVEVALIQESSNAFFVRAQLGEEELSDVVNLIIIEGVEATAEYEAATGEDHTAPPTPEVGNTEIETDESTFTIEGTSSSSLVVETSGSNGFTEETVVHNGEFSVEVSLSGNNIRDIFTLTARDAAGNVSSGLKVYITGTGESGLTDTEEEDEDEESTSFTDMAGHWSESYVNRLSDMDVISGYDDGTFRPDAPITRAELLKIALLAFGHDVEDNSSSITFSDVNSTDWYADVIIYADEADIVDGYADGSFLPNNNINRAEALKIILEAKGGITLEDVTPNFSDVNAVTDWFAAYTSWGLSNDIIAGYDDGTYRPGQNITRAEASKIVLEVLDFESE